MAVQTPFFGKREPETFQPRQPAVPTSSGSSLGAAQHVPPIVSTSIPDTAAEPTSGVGSKLTVGPNIKLKGVEITDCDTLVVEGTVEATMDSRVIQISEAGAFRGSAEIDIAEIRGTFDGTLTVRQKLVIFSTGKVSGKIRYGKLVVEEGGQLSGEVGTGASTAARAAASKPHAAESVIGTPTTTIA